MAERIENENNRIKGKENWNQKDAKVNFINKIIIFNLKFRIS